GALLFGGSDPRQHLAHRRLLVGGGEQQRREVARGGGAPERLVGERPPRSPTCMSRAAVRRASSQVAEAATGDHDADGSPVEPVGSKRRTSPCRAWRRGCRG